MTHLQDVVAGWQLHDEAPPPPRSHLQDVVAGWQLHDEAGAHRRDAAVLAQDPDNGSADVWGSVGGGASEGGEELGRAEEIPSQAL